MLTYLIVSDDPKKVLLDLENRKELSLLGHRLRLAEVRVGLRLLHVLLEPGRLLVVCVLLMLSLAGGGEGTHVNGCRSLWNIDLASLRCRDRAIRLPGFRRPRG